MLRFIHMVISRIRLHLQKGSFRLFFKNLIKKQLITGPDINEFEKQFSAYVGTKYAIAVPSGRIGLYLTLKTLGIKKGDEIILPAYNTPIVTNIVRSVNATPIFVDINSDTLNIDTELIKKKITKKTKSIIALHTEGQPCELDKIIQIAKKYGIFVIEDCAQAVGTRYKGKIVGGFGDAGYFSFGTGKFINTLKGGMIVTNDLRLAKKVRKLLKSFKKSSKFDLMKKYIFSGFISLFTYPIIFTIFVYPFLLIFNLLEKDFITSFFEDIGTSKVNHENSTKFSNFQAILGLEQLKNLDIYLKKQRENIETILKNINKSRINFQKAVFNSEPVYLHFTLISQNRSNLIRKLLWKGIDVQISWMKSCSQKGECPISDSISNQTIYIPIYYDLSKKDIKYVADILKSEWK